MEDKNFLKKDLGQSTVEYILLLAVVLFLGLSVFRSRYFQDFFSEDSRFFTSIKSQIEVAYRQTHLMPSDENQLDYSTFHRSFSVDGDESHFFISLQPYGGQ